MSQNVLTKSVTPAASVPTKFMWNSVVAGGKKKTIEETRDEKAAQRKKEQEISDTEEKYRQEKERLKLENDQRKYAEKSQLQAKQREEERLRLEQIDKKYSRENGYWTCKNQTGYNRSHPKLDVPPTVNEKAMKYVEEWLGIFPEVRDRCNSLSELKKAFAEAFVPRIIFLFDDRWRNNEPFLSYETANVLPIDNEDQRYNNLQAWVAYLEKTCKKPWEETAMWSFAKNVTFENCLWAINEKSQTFKTQNEADEYQWGFIRLEKGELINWICRDIREYNIIEHNPKEACRAKQLLKIEEERNRRMVAMDDEYF